MRAYRTHSSTTAAPWAAVVALTALLGACGGPWSPESANGLLDELETAGLVVCVDRREPLPDIVTCVGPVDAPSPEDAETVEDVDADEVASSADLTVGLTADPAGALRGTRTGGGPWIVGDDWIVIAYDGDLDRLREIRDTIGHGDLYVDVDEVPVRVDD